jgi:hypothetical protein
MEDEINLVDHVSTWEEGNENILCECALCQCGQWWGGFVLGIVYVAIYERAHRWQKAAGKLSLTSLYFHYSLWTTFYIWESGFFFYSIRGLLNIDVIFVRIDVVSNKAKNDENSLRVIGKCRGWVMRIHMFFSVLHGLLSLNFVAHGDSTLHFGRLLCISCVDTCCIWSNCSNLVPHDPSKYRDWGLKRKVLVPIERILY